MSSEVMLQCSLSDGCLMERGVGFLPFELQLQPYRPGLRPGISLAIAPTTKKTSPKKPN